MTTQIAVRLPDELLAAVDRLVDAGEADSRAAAVRTALEGHIADIERARTDTELVAGYKRIPAGTPDEWGDLGSLADWGTAASMRELDRLEDDAGSEPW